MISVALGGMVAARRDGTTKATEERRHVLKRSDTQRKRNEPLSLDRTETLNVHKKDAQNTTQTPHIGPLRAQSTTRKRGATSSVERKARVV